MIQRVSSASVTVAGEVVGRIGPGLLVLIGVADGDGETDIAYTAGKVRDLRIFPDEYGRMNRSVVETGGGVLVVSQFTLLGDTAKGNRPSFTEAAPPEEAEPLYEAFCAELRALGVTVATGRFGARMSVELVNDGPVTLVLDGK